MDCAPPYGQRRFQKAHRIKPGTTPEASKRAFAGLRWHTVCGISQGRVESVKSKDEASRWIKAKSKPRVVAWLKG